MTRPTPRPLPTAADRIGVILRGAPGQDPDAPSRLSLAPPMRRESGTRYFDGDCAVAIFVAHHFPTIAWHEHDFYELAVVATGTASTKASTGVIPVEAGTAIFIPPGVSHEYRNCEDLIVYNCLFRSDPRRGRADVGLPGRPPGRAVQPGWAVAERLAPPAGRGPARRG